MYVQWFFALVSSLLIISPLVLNMVTDDIIISALVRVVIYLDHYNDSRHVGSVMCSLFILQLLY